MLLLLSLTACNLTPVYSGGSSSAPAALAAQVSVAPIPERAGFLVRQALIDRLGTPVAEPRYRLEIELDDRIDTLTAELQRTREKRQGAANFRAAADSLFKK